MNRATRRSLLRNKRSAGQMPLVNLTSWAATIARNRETDPGIALDISVKLRDAFSEICAGRGTDELYDRLASAINAGLIRAEQIDPLIEQTMLAARDALIECDAIQHRHGRFGFSGPGLAAMDRALEAYDAIVAASTPGQMQTAMNECLRRVYAGNVQARPATDTPISTTQEVSHAG